MDFVAVFSRKWYLVSSLSHYSIPLLLCVLYLCLYVIHTPIRIYFFYFFHKSRGNHEFFWVRKQPVVIQGNIYLYSKFQSNRTVSRKRVKNIQTFIVIILAWCNFTNYLVSFGWTLPVNLSQKWAFVI